MTKSRIPLFRKLKVDVDQAAKLNNLDPRSAIQLLKESESTIQEIFKSYLEEFEGYEATQATK